MLFPRIVYACRRPSHARVIWRRIRQIAGRLASDEEHCRAALQWLCAAQDVTGCDGVAAAYSLTQGWKPPFPETSGYIIPTLLAAAAFYGQDTWLERAVRMGDWEIAIQLPNGAVRGGVGINQDPLVFDTGQVLFGWLALYERTGEKRFLHSATQAADWLTAVQDGDGKWSRHTYMGIPHAYHARVAWSLLEACRLIGDDRYRQAAERNIRWTLDQATETGWFEGMGFSVDEIPLTHTIAYTLRGLFEASRFLPDADGEKILARITGASQAIIEKYGLAEEDGSPCPPAVLPMFLDRRWSSTTRDSSPVGNAQFAILWLKLYQVTGAPYLLKAARHLIDQVKGRQSLDSSNPGIRGGIAGSDPIWSRYIPFGFPNWGAKFFVDALLLKEQMEDPGRPSEYLGRG